MLTLAAIGPHRQTDEAIVKHRSAEADRCLLIAVIGPRRRTDVNVSSHRSASADRCFVNVNIGAAVQTDALTIDIGPVHQTDS